ncbi:hypothetical protein ACIGJK_01070 [Pseudomonas iridis]
MRGRISGARNSALREKQRLCRCAGRITALPAAWILRIDTGP